MEINLPSIHAFELWGMLRDSPFRAMLLDFIEKQAQQLADSLPKPETKQSWESRAAGIKPCLLHSLGLSRLPERAPLNARILGTVEQTGYTIQKLVYESLPGLIVPAHLYLPKQSTFPAPAVLYAPGHWMENCKLEPEIQLFCANLAQLGFVVLVYDPIGQGERLGNWMDHGHLEPLLVGLSQEGLMVWESTRAIDYLVSRPEVDPQRIGMTGASGGGLNTFYTSAVDQRIQVSIPVCYITTFFSMMTAERDRNWEDGVDLCNQVPGVMAYAEMSDICGLFAPKPLCIIAGIRDWMFPIEGVRRVYENVAHIYQLYQAPERVRLSEVDSEHGYDQTMREAAYGWLARWLQGKRNEGPIPERECELLPMPYHPALTYMEPPALADLPVLRERASFPKASPGLCLRPGEVPPPGPAITALTKELADSLSLDHKLPADGRDVVEQRRKLLESVKNRLGPFPGRTLVKDRIFNQTVYEGLFAERVLFESESGIEIPALFIAPANWRDYVPVVIYVDEWGKGAGLHNGMIDAVLQSRLAVFAVDVRGVGETATTDFEAATNALMTDRPLFGQRVYDVLRAVDCLWRRIYIGVQIDKGRIACIGRGAGGLLALYAAVLDVRLATTVAWQTPVSYKSLIVEKPGFPASIYLFDVLNHFDLPSLMAALAPRPFLLADPVDGERRRLTIEEIERHCGWPRQVYTLLEADTSGFQVFAGPGKPAAPGDIASWLREHLVRPDVGPQSSSNG